MTENRTTRPDPSGYEITWTDDGRHRLTSLIDGTEVGVYDTRDEAIDAVTPAPLVD